jgi:hypothetical protein
MTHHNDEGDEQAVLPAVVPAGRERIRTACLLGAPDGGVEVALRASGRALTRHVSRHARPQATEDVVCGLDREEAGLRLRWRARRVRVVNSHKLVVCG